MKKNMSVYLPLVCVVLILSSASSTPVVDNDGDEVRAGVEYKIYSLIALGFVPQALKLGSTGNKPCPLGVVLAGFAECLFQLCGLPLTFYPEEGNLVSESSYVNIKFNATTACPESTVWQVLDGYVSSGGVVGDHQSTSWFQIVSAGLTGANAYNLVYCFRNLPLFPCWNIGFQGNDPRLSLQEPGEGLTPFYFTIGKTATPTLSSVV